MRRTIALLSALSVALPLVASAITFHDVAGDYTDEKTFSMAERAAISVLTDADVVGGNPDGSFAPRRTLNRAEFTKIAVLLGHGLVEVEEAFENRACFPDVPSGTWFAKFVCFAKKQGIVGGYPGGTFKPEQPVNYAEALKILAGVFEYGVAPGAGDRWYEPYVVEAKKRGVALPASVEYGRLLTRGEMARLAAAFYAENEGELDAYRAFERGQDSSHTSSVSSSGSSGSSESSGSSKSSSAPSSSAPSSVSSSASGLFPARNRFLIVGRATYPILDGTFTAEDEDLVVSLSDLIFRREFRSLNKIWLVDADGKQLMEYLISTSDSEKRRWQAVPSSGSGSYRLTKGKPTLLGVKVLLDSRDTGGSSDEIVEIERFSIDAVGATSGLTRQLIPSNQHYPTHVTAQAELTGAKNALPATGTLQTGLRRQIGAFTFSGMLIPGAQLKISELTFNVERTGVALNRIRIGGLAEVEQADCSVESGDMMIVSCPAIPEMVDDVIYNGGRTLHLIADVSLNGSNTQGTLRASLADPGAIGRNGAIKWTDGTGRFNWIDAAAPVAVGTMWTVTK
jgi:hypothetical protein